VQPARPNINPSSIPVIKDTFAQGLLEQMRGYEKDALKLPALPIEVPAPNYFASLKEAVVFTTVATVSTVAVTNPSYLSIANLSLMFHSLMKYLGM
jgi:hypothetical protein